MLALRNLSIRHVHPPWLFLRSVVDTMLPVRSTTSTKLDWGRTILSLGSMPDWFVSSSCLLVISGHATSAWLESGNCSYSSVLCPCSPCNYYILGCFIVVAWVACFLNLCQALCCFVMSTALELADLRRDFIQQAALG